MVYMFTSGRGALVYSFTDDPAGSKLPPEFAPWHPLGAQVMSGAGGINSEQIVQAAIGAQGYYMAQCSRIRVAGRPVQYDAELP